VLLIKVKGGLGNRVLSTASAILYAQLTGRQFQIDWRDGIYAAYGDNAYHHLFESQESCKLSELKASSLNIDPVIWKGKLGLSPSEMIHEYFSTQHSNPFIYRKLSVSLSKCQSSNEVIEVCWSYTSKLGRLKRFNCNTKTPISKQFQLVLKNYFRPVKPLSLKLDNFFSNYSGNILGVHIRYTDLRVPLEKLMRTVRKNLENNDFQHIFLATDSKEVEERFVAEFGSVIKLEKQFDQQGGQLHSTEQTKTKLEGAQAALFDLYALSKCDSLVYSSRSSFSRLSALLGDFDSSSLIDIDQYNVKVQIKNWLQEYL